MIRTLFVFYAVFFIATFAHGSVYVLDIVGEAHFTEDGVVRDLKKGVELPLDVEVEVEKGAMLKYIAPSGLHSASKVLNKYGYYSGPLVHKTVVSNINRAKLKQAGVTRGDDSENNESIGLSYFPMKRFPQLPVSVPFLPIEGLSPQVVEVCIIKDGNILYKDKLSAGIPSRLDTGKYEFQFFANNSLLYSDNVTVVPYTHYEAEVAKAFGQANFPKVSQHNLLIFAMYNSGYEYFGELLRRGYVQPHDIVKQDQCSEDYNFESYLNNISNLSMHHISEAR